MLPSIGHRVRVYLGLAGALLVEVYRTLRRP